MAVRKTRKSAQKEIKRGDEKESKKESEKESKTDSKKESKKESKSESQTNVYAILSLIFGLLFFEPLAPVLAIVFGFIALHQIKETREEGRGMAIAGIVLGFFWILLLIVLAVLIFMFIFAAFNSIVAAIPQSAVP